MPIASIYATTQQCFLYKKTLHPGGIRILVFCFSPFCFVKNIFLIATPVQAGLPDGIFSWQKSQFGKIFEGLAFEVVDMFHCLLVHVFYGHLVHFMAIWYTYFIAIWYILWSFGIFSGFGILHHEKSGNPGSNRLFSYR
jgi:hypothetical protein